MPNNVKERMLLFEKTTTFPISIFKNKKFYHSVGLSKQHIEYINSFVKLNNINGKFNNHSFKHNINYLQLNGKNRHNELVILVGPFKYDIANKNNLVFDSEVSECDASNLKVMKYNCVVQIYKLLELIFFDEDLLFNDIDKNLSPLNELERNMIEYREIDFFHHTYYMEKKLLDMVFKDNVKSIGAIMSKYSSFAGRTSKNDINQIKNIAISAITLISRTSIEQGLPAHYALTISDNYIREIGKEKNIANIDIIMQDCYRTLRYYLKITTQSIYSKNIKTSIQLIEQNLSKNITLAQISKKTGVSSSHLSRQFKKETKISFSQFVMNLRLEESKKMLKFSNYSVSQITEMIGFKS